MEVNIIGKNNYIAILFDLDGTLRYSHPSYLNYFLDCAAQLGVEDTREKRHKAIRWAHFYWAQSKHLMRDLRLYNDRDEEFLHKYSKEFLLAFGCNPEFADPIAQKINHIMVNQFRPADCVAEDVFDTLDFFRNHGLRLGIVSNRERSCQEQLDRLGLSPYFEMILIGGDINIYKPEAGIFKYALERMKIEPQEAIFVGDNYFTDVVGAQRVGIPSVLIDPERIFPEAECPVISRMGEIMALYEKNSQ
ncbi:MAG: HAD family hydrolase [Anaerolineales bacterium]|nr:HAD family hydrolase [Anaerolineales bacterium]